MEFGDAGTAGLDGRPAVAVHTQTGSGTFLIDQARLVANNVTGTIVKGSGHWLMEEATEQVIPAIVMFINEGASVRRHARLVNPANRS
jgi:pimeloyl-ACP methyl ester carboxylesterase